MKVLFLRCVAALTLFCCLAFDTQAVPVTGNLELWFNADTGVEEAAGDPAEAGDGAFRWLDQSGNARTLDQATLAKRPTLVANAINGHNALNFNGSNQWLQGASVPSIGSSSVTIFAVVTGANEPNVEEQTIFADKGWSGIVLERVTSANPALGNLTMYSNYNLGPAPNFLPTTTGTLPAGGYGPSLLSAEKVLNTSASLFINGTQAATTATGIVTAASPSGNINIGFHEYNVESYTSYSGLYAELLVYSRSLNTAERRIVDNHLAAKYDLTITTDRYAGDTLLQGNYDRDVIGIGREADGVQTTSSGAGLTITESGGSLIAGEYVMAGHRTVNNGITATSAGQQWDRVWYIDETGGADVTLAFDFLAADLAALDFDPDTDVAKLLYSATDSLIFTELGLTGTVVGNTVTFSVPDSLLTDGYYTLAIASVPEPSTLLLIVGGAVTLGCTRRRRN